MQEFFLNGPIRPGQVTEVIKKLMKRTGATITLLYLLTVSLMLASCGGGGSQGVSSEVVSGVAATGAPFAGEATIKDSSTPAREKKTVIGSDGSFALDVSDMQGPFILQAAGSANGVNYKMHSFTDKSGTANINPLSNAAVAIAAGVDDAAQVYENPDSPTLQKIKSDLPDAVTTLRSKINRLLQLYSAENTDPIRDPYRANHEGLDGMFDDVKIILSNGDLTITNAKTGAIIFTGKISDIKNGHFTDDDGNLPGLPAVPTVPTGMTATGGDSQVTLAWNAVGNATAYNIYWSISSGVTTANGTKIAGATSPYVHSGRTASTTYCYVVTAVNGAGESAASDQVSATTNATLPPSPTVPTAPTGVIATGGTKQVTISWSAVSGATSYNVYWSSTSGVTTTNGTKIALATSPTVQTGLADSTTYYYIVTAVNSTGEGAASVQVVATTLTPTPYPTVPAAPTGVTATGGGQQVNISWSAVSGATSYNLYWSTTTGVTTVTGTKIAGVTSPYAHTGLSASTAYYYIVTAVNGAGEGAPSSQATATTNAPAPTVPAAPTGVTATGGTKQVTISWSAVSGATAYNLYWSTTPGVTTVTGTKIAGATSPYPHTGRADSTAYYYVVTAQNSAGESAASSQVTATTAAPVPVIDGAALYGQYCAGCHGPLASSDQKGATAARIQAGISNISGMNKFGPTGTTPLSQAQIDAIAAALK